jgi:flagellar motor component MotA
MKFATLRAKAMKIIKKLIKLSPEILHDKDIMKILSLRLMDVSSSTRESTLDLLWYCLTKVDFDTEEKQMTFQKDFINKYLSIIVERADDSSLGVRKKVVQILAFIL